MPPARRNVFTVCLAIATWTARPPLACAQAPRDARLTGSVVSADGERVVGADVRLVGAPARGGVSDSRGGFAIELAGDDTLPRLAVRRIGFKPETVTVHLPAAATPGASAAPALVVRLSRTPLTIRSVVVTATSAESNTMIARVRERARTAGNGYFAFREEFMRSNPVQFTDILRRIPGVRLARAPGNIQTVRLRENPCAPLFWLDGIAMTGIPFDPNSQPANTIEAVEVYSSPETVPAEFRGPMPINGRSCGSVVVWTRRGERPVRAPRIGTDSIERLLNAQRVFVAAETDHPARIRTLPQPEYPDSLLAAGIGGSAVIEFIIEADGTLNVQSVGVVSATHIAFADAARVAVLDATFQPAMKADRPVAQLFQLPVTFTPPNPPPGALTRPR